MVTLVIGNSYSQLVGLTPTSFKRLRKVLSYTPDAKASYFAGGFPPKVKYLIDAKGFFPTGLSSRVADWARKERISITPILLNTPPVKLVKQGKLHASIKPYPAQYDAVNNAMRVGRGTISMPTGTGKSMVISLIIEAMKMRTLIVVPSLEIKKQLTKSIEDALGTLANITIENIDSKALQTATDYDLLIVDEAHHVAAKTYHKLNKDVWTKIRYRFFVTATPFRNQNEEQLLFEGIAGRVIYSLDYHKAVANRYIVPVEAYYIEMPKKILDEYTWTKVYSDLVVNNKERNEAIAALTVRLNAERKSTLVLVKEIKHGKILAKLTGLSFANGQDEGTRHLIQKFNNEEIRVLIGTEGILGEGVDTKPCEYVIIAGLGKAKSAFMQKVGRGVRTFKDKESCKIILIKDKSHKFCNRHFNEQCAILLEEYGIKPIKIDI